MPARRIPVLLAAGAALALAGCGTSVSVDTKGGIAVGHKTMRATGVPFTFRYPVEFREATDASVAAANALEVVGPDADSYLAVRRNGDTEMSVAALERQARRTLGDAVLSTARERHAGIPMVAITVGDASGSDRGLRSVIYGFSGAGASWLVECQSTSAQRDAIATACTQALDSLRWSS